MTSLPIVAPLREEPLAITLHEVLKFDACGFVLRLCCLIEAIRMRRRESPLPDSFGLQVASIMHGEDLCPPERVMIDRGATCEGDREIH